MRSPSPARRAHERLLEVLPVRTHVGIARPRRVPKPTGGTRPSKDDVKARRREIQALEKQGLTGREIADRLDISDATVSRYRRFKR